MNNGIRYFTYKIEAVLSLLSVDTILSSKVYFQKSRRRWDSFYAMWIKIDRNNGLREFKIYVNPFISFFLMLVANPAGHKKGAYSNIK